MSITRAILVSMICLLLLPGCWNSRSLQNLAYVTSIAVDYKDDKYTVYVQVLNFTNIAKTESVEMGKVVPNWIGKGEGQTVSDAFESIYATSQIELYWGHVKSIILSEGLMKHGLQELYDNINRLQEIRYNIYVYGTKEPLEDIFTEKSLLNLSPLETIVNTPQQVYHQQSFIYPLYGFKLISSFNEPTESTMLPSLSIVRDVWKEDKVYKPMLEINGAYFFHGKKLASWLSKDSLTGIRWIQKTAQKINVAIPDNKGPSAILFLSYPRTHIRISDDDGKVRYKIKVVVQAYTKVMIENPTTQKMEQQAAKTIRKELMFTFQKGLEEKCDPLALDSLLYRNKPKKWHELRSQGKKYTLTKDSLSEDDIDVTVRLIHSGKYKQRPL